MEQKEIAYFNNLLLGNIEVPVVITLVSIPKEVCTSSLLHNSPSDNLRNTKTSTSDKSHIAKIENCIPKVWSSGFKTSKISDFKQIKTDLNRNTTNIKKMESKVLRATITTLLESLDHACKPFWVKCTS